MTHAAALHYAFELHGAGATRGVGVCPRPVRSNCSACSTSALADTGVPVTASTQQLKDVVTIDVKADRPGDARNVIVGAMRSPLRCSVKLLSHKTSAMRSIMLVVSITWQTKLVFARLCKLTRNRAA